MTTHWSFDQLIGYLETWSALQHYLKANGQNPIALIHERLKNAWGEIDSYEIKFPLLLRVGHL